MFEGKDVKVLLAVAGSGKTSTLVKYIEEELKTRRPEEIAFVTFTKKGADEGLRRVCDKFCLTPEDLPYFRTLHSLTFHALNLKVNQVFSALDQKEFNKTYGYYVNRVEVNKGKAHPTKDSLYLDYYDLERSNALTSKQIAESDIDVGYYRSLVRKYEDFKASKCAVDFFDCLIKYVQEGDSLPCKVVMIDECFSPDTKVRMADMSIKEIKDIKVGEYVMGTGSKSVKVTAVHKGTDIMYDVKSMKGDLIFTCNSKHLIKQYTGYITDEWRRAEELTKDSFGVYVDRQNYKQPKQTATWARVQVIEKGIGNYIGITVEAEDHLFLLANGAIVHNCQDITALQWKVIEKAFKNAEKVYVAGDDKQSIYTYSGARPDILINLSKQYPVEHLTKSYRIPLSVYRLANAITEFIGEKTEQKSEPRIENGEGSITQLSDTDRLAKIITPVLENKNESSWFILARNKCFLNRATESLEDNLIPYWTVDGFFMGGEVMKRLTDYESFKLEGYKSEEKRQQFAQKFGITDFSVPFTSTNLFTEGRKWVYASYIEKYGLDFLKEMCKWKPQILVSTIHAQKGAEADNVAVLLDATRKTKRNVFEDIDEELRCLYVAVTRTKKNLYFIDSQDSKGYDDVITTLKNQFCLDF